MNSFYSKTKGFMEDMLKSYDNVLILRVRMPISDVRVFRHHLVVLWCYYGRTGGAAEPATQQTHTRP